MGDESIAQQDKLGVPAEKSKGHVCFHAYYEFMHGPDGMLYRAPIHNPIGLDGYRMGARFECMPRADGHRRHLADAWGCTLPEE